MATNKDKLIASAQKLVEKGSYEKAIKEYLKVVEADEKDVRIWLKIGDLYSKIGKKQEAAETYGKVAGFYSEQGFYLKAVAVYKQILKIDPRLIDINKKLAELYKQLGLLSDAMQQYEALSAAYSKEGKPKEALWALKQIVELDPETVASRIKLAELYSKEGMAREAIAELTQAADQLREAGRTDEFMKVAERLLFHAPENLPVTKELANLYIEKGDPRRALPKLQVCFKADPRDVQVLSMLARAFEALDQLPKAVSVLKELARIHSENRDNKSRDEIYRWILKLAPDDQEAQQMVGKNTKQMPTKVARPPAAAPPASSKDLGNDEASFLDETPNTQELDIDDLDGIEDADEFDVATSLEVEAERPSLKVSAGRTFAAPDDDHTDSKSGTDDEEIAKVLNETDVYIKYHLHLKAIEHIQRVFERNPIHTIAREKLKALYLIVGKRDEAVRELWLLAENAEPGHARRYLREILEIEPDNGRAASLLGDRASAEMYAPASVDADETEPGGRRRTPSMVDAPEIDDADYDLAASAAAELDDEFPTGARGQRSDEDLIPLMVEPAEAQLKVSVPAQDTRSRKKTAQPGVQLVVGDISDGVTQDEFEQPTPAIGYDSSNLEDDLDEADFFIQQRLFDEARAILNRLLERYPKNPLVLSKFKEIEAGGDSPLAADEPPAEAPAEFSAADLVTSDEAAGGLPISEPPPITTESGELSVGRKGVIERGVNAEDFETHYDLGIAYKEMGLHDDAINEFRIVMKDSAREVQCHLMIGLCFLEKGMQTEAINQFKKGLYVDGITDRETLSLYFELGIAYEKLGDAREALYYFEKVLKRDPRFRDVEKRIEGLRTGSKMEELPQGTVDDVDAAFATIVGKETA